MPPDSPDAGPSLSALESVLAWLRQPARDPGFLEALPAATLEPRAAEIVSHFLAKVHQHGFALALINNGAAAAPAWAGHWTFRGSNLEGFRQAPDSPTESAARLLACAALLKNEWCLARLG